MLKDTEMIKSKPKITYNLLANNKRRAELPVQKNIIEVNLILFILSTTIPIGMLATDQAKVGKKLIIPNMV